MSFPRGSLHDPPSNDLLLATTAPNAARTARLGCVHGPAADVGGRDAAINACAGTAYAARTRLDEWTPAIRDRPWGSARCDVSHRPRVIPGSPPQLRVARPSRDLDSATRFYTQALGFEVLVAFADHACIDGVILGHPNWPYHLELTRRRVDPLMPRPTDEDLLVFYLPDRSHWEAVSQRVRDFGAPLVPSCNPYWNERGVTFEDPDGYRVVLENASWP